MKINDSRVPIFAGLGMFLSTLDTGIINVALPTLKAEFQTSVINISWTMTLYVLTISSLILFFGRLSDQYGRARLYRIGVLVFLCASIGCGYAQTVGQLIASRVLQGIGAAFIQATAASLITTLVAPERRAQAMATLGILIGLGPIFGPSLGGAIISFASWRWIFWINVPICLFILWGSYRFSSQFDSSIKRGKIYYTLLVGPLVGTIAFGVASACVFIIPPFYLEQVFHYEPWRIGLVSLCAPLGVVWFSYITGRWSKMYDCSILICSGLACMLIALGGILALYPENVIIMSAFLFLYGVGGGLFQAPSMIAIMACVDESRQATMGAVNRLIQNMAIAVGSAASAMMIGQYQIWLAWVFAFVVVIIAFIVNLFLYTKKTKAVFGVVVSR